MIAAKAEQDKQKISREYQKEVKQLYKDLNEKSDRFDGIRDRHAALLQVCSQL